MRATPEGSGVRTEIEVANTYEQDAKTEETRVVMAAAIALLA
ncbi:hypothetical protein ABZY14_14105 [Streptomyces sp. NPDC006617]